MMTQSQKDRASLFMQMHQRAGLFVLPNAWSAGSASVFEKEGFEAVATSSAGVAYDLGYPDGEDITLDDLVLCVERIVRRVGIPVSVDFERGYGENIRDVVHNAKRVLLCGAVGLNIEDGRHDGTLDPLEEMLGKISALSELKKELDLDFVINARTCTYWLDVADDATKLKIAIERGQAFRDAGADCIFIPGAMEQGTVQQLVQNIKAPVNVILNPVFHDVQKLEAIGVKRLSIGSGAVRSVFNHLIRLADDLKSGKPYDMFNHPFSYRAANQYFTK